MDLTNEKATGSQSTTQNPQVSPEATSLTGGSDSIQATTNTDTLDTSSDAVSAPVPLTSTPVPTTQLSATTAAETNLQVATNSPNFGLSALSVLLFITAAVLFISTFRSSKNTTN